MLFRLVVHSGILAFLNLTGLWLGFVAFSRLETSNQVGIQFPVGFTGTVGFFLLWMGFASARGWGRLRVHGWGEGHAIFGLALFWGAVVFVPLHFLTQGYTAGFRNVLALWAFQSIANSVAISCGVKVFGRPEERGTT